MIAESVDVLIVGGSLVGLSATVLLRGHGVDYARLRSDRRARAALTDSDLGAVLLFDQNSIR